MAFTAGKASQLDQEIYGLIAQKKPILKNIVLGELYPPTLEEFLANVAVYDNYSLSDLRFVEVFASSVRDSLANMPTKITERMHSYTARCNKSLSTDSLASYQEIRKMIQAIMDQIQNNYRPNQTNGIQSEIIDLIKPSTADRIAVESFQPSGLPFYTCEITFDVTERLGYD